MIAIEISNERNCGAYFPPLDRALRGEFDLAKCAEPTAKLKSTKYPLPIPGLRVELNPKTKSGAVIDPLHEMEFKAIADQIKRQKMELGPEEEIFSDVDIPSWLHYMKALVDAGHAQLVTGSFPDKLPGKPIMRYLTMDAPDRQDKSDAVLDKLASVLDRLADVLEDNRE